MKTFLNTLTLFLLSTLYTEGQQKFLFNNPKKVSPKLFEPVDLVFKVKNLPAENPFDLHFGAVFKVEGDAPKTIPGFYNGNNEFVIRYSGEHIGIHHFKTYSSMPELSGLSGELNVQDANNVGAVVVDPQHDQKLSYQNGDPYFALTFECDWLFALDYENKKDLPRTRMLLDEVRANGFNQVVMNVYAYDVRWPVPDDVPDEYSFKKPPYTVFDGTNENPDFENLNVDFFKHLDRVINLMNEKNLVAHLMIYVWNKQVNWPEMYSDADNRYFDYVLKRYQAYPNILWDVSKEALDYGRCDIPYINERISRIRKTDAYGRLLTVHDYEYCSQEPGRVDIISIQNWRSDLYSLSLEAAINHADKPVMNIEHGGYERGPYPTFVGNYTSPEVCLERNYECVFAGVYSTYYWQNTSWDVVIYDMMDEKHSFPKPRFDYYRHLQKLMSLYNFNKLKAYKPKLTINSRLGSDNLATSGYPLTDDNGLFLYYIPAENDMINVVIPKFEKGKFEATWFNIFTGEMILEKTTDYQMFKSYKTPWEGKSSVLILKSL